VLVGYHINPGGKWSGDYYVIDWDIAYKNKESQYLKARRVGEISLIQGPPKFPFKGIEVIVRNAEALPIPTCPPKTPGQIAEAAECEDAKPVKESPAGPSSSSDAEAVSSPSGGAETKGPNNAPEKLPEYKAGQWIPKEAFDPSRLPQGFVYEAGRVTRKAKTSRPPNITPEVWRMMSPKWRKGAIEEYEANIKAENEPQVSDAKTSPSTASAAKVCPIMPRSSSTKGHREKWTDTALHGLALVARPVGRQEVESNPAAKTALKKEIDALRDLRAWEEDKVLEWASVRDSARWDGRRVHVGRIFGFVVEKNAELPDGDPRKKFKGRFVFQGNQVKDEEGLMATFQDLGSAPASMAAGKMIDVIALQQDCSGGMADAVRAYTQATLKGTETWIRLPREHWPRSWFRQRGENSTENHKSPRGANSADKSTGGTTANRDDSKFRDPVVPLRLALYGHPDAGSHWEKHCEAKLLEQGFTPVQSWPGVFTHASLKILLAAYVDDFKMAGQKRDLKKAWELVGKAVQIEPPTPFGRYLGCEHKVGEMTLDDPDKVIGRNLAGIHQSAGRNSCHDKRVEGLPKKVKSLAYDMADFMGQCVDAYLELAKRPVSSLPKAPTPFVDESTAWVPKESVPTGQLADIALKSS